MARSDRRRSDSRLESTRQPGVFIQPIGFLCDHVEVLYDIDIGFKQFAEKESMRLWRADSLNDSPLLTAALAELVRSAGWDRSPARGGRRGVKPKGCREDRPMKRIAIIGGGISGLSAAFALEQRRSAGAPLEYVLFESSARLGGVLLTECLDDCLVEAGPDSFLTEKPWAADLCRQLGLADQLIGSNDGERRTYIADQGPSGAHARRADVHGADQDSAHGFFSAIPFRHETSHGSRVVFQTSPRTR